MSKFLSAVALATAAFAAPAFADVGLETGTAGYTVSGSGTFAAATSAAVSFDAATYGVDYATTITPAVGSYFGVLTTDDSLDAPTTLTYTYATATTTVDTLALRFVTTDAYEGAWNDTITLKLYDSTGTAYFNTTYTATEFFGLTGTDYYPDSGWLKFSVAAGTSKFEISIANTFEAGNAPTAYVDYYKTPVTTPAVPEAGSIAMTLAGLAAVGLMARRRRAA
ncbi:PEP-CTERM sorting domain-containing protein [Aquabacterium sp.]|uniref:PEP-CTERM sorting domain-containing protein n=1 Tax=Aquabacterium sp. TaxID=1872578 RepID=UPI0025C4E367|nr:PEP-CTERM sorting domain-containing protein [Aquabacterium sp.]